MTRVIHTGDTHLGYSQYHSEVRRGDFMDAFRQVAADAVEDDVDAVVHAGDLYHDRRPGLEQLLGTLEVLRALDDAGVPFLAVVGNHEATRGVQWLDLFESMDLATRLGSGGHVVGDTTFYGLDHVPAARRDDVEYTFDSPGTEHAALVSHGLFQPFPYGDWDLAGVLDAADVDFDAVLLGDNHHPQRERVAGTLATYCGSTERASADERDARGYNLVTFDGDVSLGRRGLDTREFVFLDLELDASEGVERVRDRLREHDLTDAVVVVTVEGDGDPVAPAEVESFARDRGALVARVTDRREVDPGAETDVTFADPDAAVRERVRELGLSEAARDLDETVRAGDVPDTGVADAVEEHVRDLVDDRPDAFDAPDDEGGDADDREGVEDGHATDAANGEGGTDVAESEAVDAGAAASAVDGGEAGDSDGTADAGDADAAGTAVPDGDGSGQEDGQSSMEEYL